MHGEDLQVQMLIKIEYNDQDDWRDDVQNQMMPLPDRSIH